ncbi:MAG: flagellar hook-associated protein FlgK [Eubacteriales bacterium]|nr:flagellar hook-associated protein FlgK [Eubacteriales bacterium]
MRSTFYGLEVARSGLYTAQSELNITGHNVSNVDTQGYTRQRLDTAAKVVAKSVTQFAIDSKYTTGQGSEALKVGQIRDLFLDKTYREENAQTTYWDTCETQFYSVEQIFNSVLEDSDSSASIYNALEDFGIALNNVSKNVSSKDIRTTLVEAGIQLTESFNSVYGKLAEQHSNINTNISTIVDQINDTASYIAELNEQIFGYEMTGSQANDLRDKRNNALDELSGYIGIDYYEDIKGQMVVTIGGRELVSGAESNKIVVNPMGTDNVLDVLSNEPVIGKQYTVTWADAFGKPSVVLKDQIKPEGGELQAYFDLRDGTDEDTAGIPYVVEQLNELARKIAREVNAIHETGYTLPFTLSQNLAGGEEVMYHRMNEDGTPNVNENGQFIMERGIQAQQAKDGTWYFESVQGLDFFNAGNYADYSEVNARNFSLSAAVLNSTHFIAGSSEKVLSPDEKYDDVNQLMGNNSKVNEIIDLFNRKDELGLPNNFSSGLTTLVTSVGTTEKHFINMNAAQASRQAAVEQQRQSVSGVSLDDEMTDMVRYTHAYNAAARILTAIDDELDTLINKMGTVGR